MQANHHVFRFYSSGILDSNECGKSFNHAVVVVGYTNDAWIVRNSWGTGWGEAGYVRIRKDTGRNAGICGIA